MVKSAKSDIIFFEAFDEEQKLLRKLCPSHIRAEYTSQTIQESKMKDVPAALVSIRTQSKIPFGWAPALKGILTRSTGFDHVLDYRDQTKCEAALGYLPSYCARAVAEQAILMMLALWRKLKTQQQCFHFFCRDGLTGLECQDKKMLVVGVGNIGSEIVDIARGLHMKVAGVDIDRKLPSLEYTDLTSGLSWADVVVCALSLTQETKEMLSYETLRRVKTGTIFINIARGEISPLKDLKRLLDEQILGAVGLDVYDDEEALARWLRSDKKDDPDENIKVALELKDHPNVIFTPHNAFNTQEALGRKAEQTMESAVSFLTQQVFPFPVPETQS